MQGWKGKAPVKTPLFPCQFLTQGYLVEHLLLVATLPPEHVGLAQHAQHPDGEEGSQQAVGSHAVQPHTSIIAVDGMWRERFADVSKYGVQVVEAPIMEAFEQFDAVREYVDACHLKGREIPEQREEESPSAAAHVEQRQAQSRRYYAMKEPQNGLDTRQILLRFEVMVFAFRGIVHAPVSFVISSDVGIQKGGDVLLYHRSF